MVLCTDYLLTTKDSEKVCYTLKINGTIVLILKVAVEVALSARSFLRTEVYKLITLCACARGRATKLLNTAKNGLVLFGSNDTGHDGCTIAGFVFWLCQSTTSTPDHVHITAMDIQGFPPKKIPIRCL